MVLGTVTGEQDGRVAGSRDTAICLDEAKDAFVEVCLGIEISDVKPEMTQARSGWGFRGGQSVLGN